MSRNIDKQNTRGEEERISKRQAGSFLHFGPRPLLLANKHENMKKMLLVGRSALLYTLKDVYADLDRLECLAVFVGRVPGRLCVFRGSRLFSSSNLQFSLRSPILLGDRSYKKQSKFGRRQNRAKRESD